MLEINHDFIKENYGSISWEAVLNTNVEETVDRDNRELGTPQRSLINGLIIRVLLPDKRVGLAVDTNPGDWKQCFRKAYKVAKVSEKREGVPSIDSHARYEKDFQTFKDFNSEELLKGLRRMQDGLGQRASLIKMNVNKNKSVSEYHNSNNSRVVCKEDNISAYIQIGQEGRMGHAYSSKRLELPNFRQIVNEALKYYNWSGNRVKVESEEYPVLFAHDALKTVLQPVLYSLLGDNIVEEKSNYCNKLGERVLSSKINLYDNPRHENNFSPFDCEGYETRKTRVIEDGVIKSYLHDSFTSEELNLPNTYNSSDIMSKPSVSFFNPEMQGNASFQEMLNGLKEGFLIYDLYPSHTVDEVTGDYGLNSSTFFYIKNGEVIGTVKEGVVTGNTFETFQSIESISRETRSDLGDYNLPVVKTNARVLTQ